MSHSKLTEVDLLLAEINKIIDEFDDKKGERGNINQ